MFNYLFIYYKYKLYVFNKLIPKEKKEKEKSLKKKKKEKKKLPPMKNKQSPAKG